MTKDTELFIKALKHGMNELQNKDSENKSLRDIAIDYLCSWSGCTKSAYNEANLYDVVLSHFLDYLDTANKPSAVIRRYLESRRLRGYSQIESVKNKTEVDDMLTTLMMTQVKDNDGNYVNGFTKLIES